MSPHNPVRPEGQSGPEAEDAIEAGLSLHHRIARAAAGFVLALDLIGDCPEVDQARARLAEATAWAEAGARGHSLLRE